VRKSSLFSVSETVNVYDCDRDDEDDNNGPHYDLLAYLLTSTDITVNIFYDKKLFFRRRNSSLKQMTNKKLSTTATFFLWTAFSLTEILLKFKRGLKRFKGPV